MNGVIYYIWQNRLLKGKELHTTNGEKMRIIDYGTLYGKSNIANNAKIMIGDQLWSGNIVLHNKSSDWEQEIRNGENIYENVILHVTINNDCETIRRHGEAVHQLQINCTESLLNEYREMEENKSRLACAEAMSELENVILHSLLSRLLMERIEEKAEKIDRTFNACDKKWDDTLFKTIARSFGFGIQSNVFEEWASILNMQALGKHRDNLIQVEAILFGQAGLLNEESIPYYYRESAFRSNYFIELIREYTFLERKFGLKTMDYKAWGSSNATPHLRIARLAAIYYNNCINMSSISACNTCNELRKMLDTPLYGYWHNHTCFGGTETCGNANLKERHSDIIIINAIVPILFVYGKRHNDPTLCIKAEDYLHLMKSEENSIVRRWKEQGIMIECAADSQAFIQLNKKYCSVCNCKNCYFAYHYIKKKLAIV